MAGILNEVSGVRPTRDIDTLLIILVRYLDLNGINYVLPALPNVFPIGDEAINFIICKEGFKKIAAHVEVFCKQNNLLPVQKFQLESTSFSFILSDDHERENGFNPIKIRFCSSYERGGRLYLSATELLTNRSYVYEKKCWILKESFSFIYYLIKAINDKSISQCQFKNLLIHWTNGKAGIVQKLQQFFNERGIIIITESFEKANVDHLNARLGCLTKELEAKVPVLPKSVLQDKMRLLKSALKPSGLVVGILGRDGSGKSTFINEISESLGSFFRCTTCFKKMPSVFYKGAIFNKNEGYHISKPHQYKERGSLASFLKINLLFIEFMLGYWIKVFPFKAKSHLVLYDRYFVDVLADPLRYRIKGNKFFIKIIHRILPKPDLWIILDLPSEILLQRKQELNFEMAEKLRHEYLNLHSFLPNSIVINNKNDIRYTVKEASAFILNHIQQRRL